MSSTYEQLKQTIDKQRLELFVAETTIENNKEALQALELSATIFRGKLDFDNLKHPEIIKVIQAFGGKWEKTVSCDAASIDYVLERDGKTVARCWQGEPPPACKIVEEWVDVPASKQIRRRIVCPETKVPGDPIHTTYGPGGAGAVDGSSGIATGGNGQSEEAAAVTQGSSSHHMNDPYNMNKPITNQSPVEGFHG